ncbi:MAG TPA: hypothetical protein VKA54_13265 [Gemmatimonadaceae bacterium]|nr:hypothetical protein [Gemmatimonadaceae bacterium]
MRLLLRRWLGVIVVALLALLALAVGPASMGVAPQSASGATCPSVDDTLMGVLVGGLAGFVLTLVPAVVLAFTRFRHIGVVLALVGIGAGAALFGGINWLLRDASCPTRYAAAEVDAHIDTDSLYRLWQRFAAASDPHEQRVIARAIHCERLRIWLIEPYGRAVVDLAESRVATPSMFRTLNERALRAYPSPSPGVVEIRPDDLDPKRCNAPTGTIVGRVFDQETREPVVSFLMGVAGVGTFFPRDSGRFILDHLPARADSLLLYVCPTDHQLTTRRVRVGDGETDSLDISIVRPKRGPGEFVSGADSKAKLDVCRNADKEPTS